jgi:hypothetical protein
MLWHHKRRKHEDEDGALAGTTVGQKLDLGEVGMEVLMRGGAGIPQSLIHNTFNLPTFGFGMVDLAVSSANAPKGHMAERAAGAVGAQVAGITGYTVGQTVGASVGAMILPGIGGFVGTIVGSGLGAIVSDQIGRSGVQRTIRRVMETRGRVRFGGYEDTQPAYTMRARGEQELSNSLLNARRYLGREAHLMHQ